MTERGSFAFGIVRPGSEPQLKAEASRRGLRLAFSRPGLLTFKDPSGAVSPTFGADLVHARVAGLSLGQFDAPEAIAEAAGDRAVVLHVFARVVGEERVDRAPIDAVTAALAQRLRAAPLNDGALVLDVAVHPGEPLFAGLHVHGPGRSRAPGGVPDVVVPERAPSRAYAKLVEALELMGEVMRPGEHAVELGSAPGGTTLAMLEAGVSVTAIDPAAMDPGVLSFVGPSDARARHLAIPAGAVVPSRLPAQVDWMVVDLNLAPPVALRYVARIVRARMPRRGAILTLKMNDQSAIDAIPDHLERVRGMGFTRLLARQLPANRSEITVLVRR